MTDPVPIDTDTALQEARAEIAYLRNRTLILAQALKEARLSMDPGPDPKEENTP